MDAPNQSLIKICPLVSVKATPTVVASRETDLRVGVLLVGGLAPPCGGLRVVLRARLGLRKSMSLVVEGT